MNYCIDSPHNPPQVSRRTFPPLMSPSLFLSVLQDSCQPTCCQPMKRWSTARPRLLLPTPLCRRHRRPPTHPRTSPTLALPQPPPTPQMMIRCVLPLPSPLRRSSTALSTPTRTPRRAGTGASRGTLESKCAMARICGISRAF